LAVPWTSTSVGSRSIVGCGDQHAALTGGQQRQRPGDQAGHGLLDPGDLPVAEATRQRRGRGRRRRWQAAAQQPAHPVGALVVAVDQEVPTGQQRLGQPDQQLARAKAAAATLDRPDLAVDRGDHAKGADRLGDHHQPCRRSGSGRRRATRTVGGAVASSSPGRCLSLGASAGVSNPDSL
jgi:hypothetical protein